MTLGCVKIESETMQRERATYSTVIVRESGRSSIPEKLVISREAAAYWIPAFAGMTTNGGAFVGTTNET
jgi:hypothetical protein